MSPRRSPLAGAGGAIVLVFGLVAILAPLLAPFDPHAISGPSLASPSPRHLLGTNDAGQDILSQLVWGARAAAFVALPAASLAVLAGLVVGGACGLVGGWPEALTMRMVDVLLAVPVLPLLILVAALAGPSRTTVVVLIAAVAWPSIARVVHSQTLTLARRGHYLAARGFGAGPAYLIRRHLAPALAPVLTANLVTWAATAIVFQAGLAFLGLSDPTEVSWGLLLNRALTHEGVYFSSEWIWWVLPAGFAIVVVATGLALLGVAMEPRANPRWDRAR